MAGCAEVVKEVKEEAAVMYSPRLRVACKLAEDFKLAEDLVTYSQH